MNIKRYVVGLVFDYEFKEIMFVKRKKEPFKDCINGIGGKIEENESTDEAMKRETFEETDIKEEHISKLKYMFTISFQEGIELNVYYIILNNQYVKKASIDIEEGILIWKNIVKDDLLDASQNNIAGEGNIAYFIKYALCREEINL